MESKGVNKVGSYEIVAEPFHVDFNGELTLGVLGNHLLNCASFHSAERGFGIASLNEENYTWVLSRLAIEIKQMPKEYEKFTIETWVEDVYKLFTDRNFLILNSEGEEIGYARSIWAMINMENRMPANLFEIHGDEMQKYVLAKSLPIDKPSRIKVQASEPVYSHTAKYCDIDINGHVNSMRYIEHILDLYPKTLYESKRIQRFEMAYVTESYYDDRLDFFMDSLGDDHYNIDVKKENGETVCRSKIVFK